jgi:hypothetical protein
MVYASFLFMENGIFSTISGAEFVSLGPSVWRSEFPRGRRWFFGMMGMGVSSNGGIAKMDGLQWKIL